ncbi:two-component regulator propeller domain-containing protein [Aquiflexum gelatinilyticum]|uniref:two-component regulator propeller domain-containing protein n=1 Tax=Aquiflexum gelatinilyticum TaxID=2961943 RepID=UPI002167B1D2|nr:two-component regulator propeller domain-containing protein [Aquiflexum gelatinilyticum]MCS4433568.1 regulator [Aquiflexum gelatinilyticum]
MKYVCLISILCLIALDLSGQIPGLPISKFYSSKEYQGGIQNFAISQSESGLIYVANNFGLLEYDGTTWRRYSLPNSTKIRDVSIDENGIIYVAGQGEFGYFKPDEQGFLQYHSLLNLLPESYKNLEEIWKIFLLHNKIIFCTFQEVFTFSDKYELISITENKPEFESFHLSNNRVFANQLENGLYIFENEKFISEDFGDYFKGKLVTGIISQGNNQKLVFTRDHGIYTSSSAGVVPWKNEIPFPAKINEAIRLKNGSLAIGTQSNGLFVIDDSGDIVLQMEKENGLQNNSIISLFEDISGNLWIGHNNGITLLELSLPFRLIDQYAGLPGTGYNAAFHMGAIYYGTNNGLSVQKFDEGKSLPIEAVPGSSGQVYRINQIQNNLLMAHNDGAFTIKDFNAIPAGGMGGIWNFQSLKDNPDLVIAGSYSGLQLFRFEGDQLKFLRKLKGFDESSRIFEQDMDGTIWMTHGYKGVYRLRLNSELDSLDVKYYGTESGLPTSLLISVWKINNRLIFSTEYGIYSYNAENDKFEADSFFSKYFDFDFLATSMVEDPLGNIFYIGDKEVGVLEKQINGTYVKNHQIFNKIIPFLNDDLQNISLIRSNEVLFAANDGFIWYKLENKTPSTPSFPTIIRAVYLTGQSDSLVFNGNYRPLPITPEREENQKVPSFEYDLANIRFEFSNPIPNNENSTQFQFWLEGFEEGFGEWTYKRDKAYTNLKEGKYTFHVRSKNIYGQISEANAYSFRILPPWYRSAFAYLIYFILVIGTAFATYRLVEKRYHKKTIRITDSQRKALIQKETALKTSQEELEKLRNEKLESEIQAKDKELASATMHLINKNGFIDQTKNHLNSIIKKSKNQEVKSEIEKVINSIDKNIAGDKDWEQFEIHFDQVHGDFMNRFKKQYPDLSPQEIKLSAYLRMNLSSKEIAYLMNISTRGIEIARYRLRKKMQLERTANLQEFILKF